MRIIMLLGAVTLLASCATTTTLPAGQSNSEREQPKPLDDNEITYIARIEADGRLLYEKDIRAANATDILLSRISSTDYPNFIGWVTYPNAEDFTVSFYEKTGDEITIISDVIYSKKSEPVVDLRPSRKVTDTELSMINARATALQVGANSCSDRFNTVVIPSQSEEFWDVYVLAATTNPRLVQVGGHVKVTVSKNTAETIEITPLSKSCLALDKSGDGLPEGASLSALSVSHIVSPMPAAIHPYLNLLHDIKLAVMSERGLWMVSSGEIELL